MESLHDQEVAFTVAGGSTGARVAFAPRTPVNDRLRELLARADATNIKGALLEASRLAEDGNLDHTAFIVELSKVFQVAFPGEPLPITFE